MTRNNPTDDPIREIARDMSATLIEAAGGPPQVRISEADRRAFDEGLTQLVRAAGQLLKTNTEIGPDAKGRTQEQVLHLLLDQPADRNAALLAFALVRLGGTRNTLFNWPDPDARPTY